MTLPLRTSRTGLEFIKSFEGFRARAARLPDGRWTIGHGHVRSAREGVRITRADAHSLLIYDLQKIEEEIEPLILTPLNQNQFDALVCFVYNISPGLFRESDVLRRLNAGDHLGAAKAMECWCNVRISGRLTRVDALVRRRTSEAARFLEPQSGRIAAPTPFYPPEPEPVRNGAGSEEVDVSGTAPGSPDVGGDVGSLRDAIRAIADKQRDQTSPTAARSLTGAADDDQAELTDEMSESGGALKTPLDVAAQMRARINRVLEREEAAVASREHAPVEDAITSDLDRESESVGGDAFSLSGSLVARDDDDDIASRVERALNGAPVAAPAEPGVVSSLQPDLATSEDDVDRSRIIVDDTTTISMPPAHRWTMDDDQPSRIPWHWVAPLTAGVSLAGWGLGRLLFAPSLEDVAADAADTLSPVLILGGGILIVMAIYFLVSRRKQG